MKTSEFHKGYDQAVQDIEGMGWEATRNKLNDDLPPGKASQCSPEMSRWYAGYAEALSDRQK